MRQAPSSLHLGICGRNGEVPGSWEASENSPSRLSPCCFFGSLHLELLLGLFQDLEFTLGKKKKKKKKAVYNGEK